MRLIDADELKEAMEEHTDYKGYLVCAPEEVIDLAPTVEARPHGEWIDGKLSGNYCPFCNYHNLWKTNFCPRCGEDFREENENEIH